MDLASNCQDPCSCTTILFVSDIMPLALIRFKAKSLDKAEIAPVAEEAAQLIVGESTGLILLDFSNL